MSRRSELRAAVGRSAEAGANTRQRRGGAGNPARRWPISDPEEWATPGIGTISTTLMRACAIHARSTDDLSSGEWEYVDGGRAGSHITSTN